jgi:hypothetical protein
MPEKKKSQKKPDGRGKRPRDLNRLAKWIVEKSTEGTKTKPESDNNQSAHTQSRL